MRATEELLEQFAHVIDPGGLDPEAVEDAARSVLMLPDSSNVAIAVRFAAWIDYLTQLQDLHVHGDRLAT